MNPFGHDLFLKTTDKEGNVTFSTHRVWNGSLFMQARVAEHEQHGGSVVQLTKEQFDQQRNARKAG